MQALPAITLSENQPQNVSLPIGITAIQLHNASVGFLMVSINSDSTYVGPQSSVTIPLGGQTTSMTLLLLDASTGTVYATVFMATDGNLPNSLASGSLNQQQVNVAGGQLSNTGGVAIQPTGDQLVISDLGTGVAGAVSFGANATLAADLQATSITVPHGVVIETGGYRIRCQGTCLVNGTIDNSAQNSSGSIIGAPGATGTLAGGASGVGITGANSVNGLTPVSATLEGGSGGNAGGKGGITPTPISSPTISLIHTGSLSGGASGGAVSGGSGYYANSGSGGGVVLILCSELDGSGMISANGGNGGSSNTMYATSGGGGGGVVIVACYTNNFAGFISANGGYPSGNGGTPGVNGTATILVTS